MCYRSMLQRLDYSAKLHLLKKKAHQTTVLQFSLASHSFSSITQMHKGKRQKIETDAQEVLSHWRKAATHLVWGNPPAGNSTFWYSYLQ